MRVESEARGSRRNMKPPPVPVRLTVKGKEKAKAKLRHLLPQKAHVRNEENPLMSTRSLTSTLEGGARHTFQELHTQRTKGTV